MNTSRSSSRPLTMLRRFILLLDALQSALIWLRFRLQIAELTSVDTPFLSQSRSAWPSLERTDPDPWAAWAEGEGAEVLERLER